MVYEEFKSVIAILLCVFGFGQKAGEKMCVFNRIHRFTRDGLRVCPNRENVFQ